LAFKENRESDGWGVVGQDELADGQQARLFPDGPWQGGEAFRLDADVRPHQIVKNLVDLPSRSVCRSIAHGSCYEGFSPDVALGE